MKLLYQLQDQGYPDEYLLSRIRARRSRLVRDWKPLIYEEAIGEHLPSRYQGFLRERAPEAVWCSLVREYRWVYEQMNGKLRETFDPFFLYTELRTLFICLRQIKDKSTGRVSGLLDASLLSPGVKKCLAGSADIPAALDGIEPLFTALSPGFAGLAETFESGGLRGVEQKVTNTYLSVMSNARIPPLLRAFFARLIDARNILSLFKFQHLGQEQKPPFIEGGAIGTVRFHQMASNEDTFGICSLIRRFSGIRIDRPEPAKVEAALYRGITRFLKEKGREPFGAGPILDYLWKCSLEATNASILLNSTGLERELVAAELQ